MAPTDGTRSTASAFRNALSWFLVEEVGRFCVCFKLHRVFSFGRESLSI